MTEPEKGDAKTVAFTELGLAPKLLEALDQLGFEEPTPIQAKAIPVGLEGRDIFGIAQTGTGKTMAFGLPMLQRIARQGGRGLIVLPTRELALQVEESLHRIGKDAGLRTAVLIGGASMEPQLKQLRANPHVVVCTPGRILDHLEHKNISLKETKVVVLDEADRMLDMGFMPQVRRILMATPRERQTMLFSATMPDEVAHLAERYMKDPIRVEVDRAGTPAELVEHRLYVVPKDAKNRLLDHLLNVYTGTVLVFTRTRHGAARVCRAVRRMNHSAAEIHSDRTLAQRRASLDGFKSGKYRVLVATDIAARGIDVTGIELVVNYDIPDQADDYVHRIGRTGRAGERGLAISMAIADQGDAIREIEKVAGIMLDITPLPELPPDRPRPPRSDRDRGHRGRYEKRDSRGSSRGQYKPSDKKPAEFKKKTVSRDSKPAKPEKAIHDPNRPRLTAKAIAKSESRSIAEGPKGIGVSDMGDTMPDIGAMFFEGLAMEKPEKPRFGSFGKKAGAKAENGGSQKRRRRRRRK